MIALYFSSILSLYLFIIFGVFIAKFAKLSINFFEKTLIGLVVANTITTILSLFLPINIYVLIALLLCSSILIFSIKYELKSLFLIFKTKKIIILYTLPFILIASVISLTSPQNWDTGLYHLQSIKWIEEYAVVPGLANLHGRFGFNPNIFTFFALTSLFDIFKQEIFSVNFSLFSVLALYFVNKLYLIFKQYGITNLFVFNLIIFITILNLSYNLSSPSPDYISITFPLFILSSLFKATDIKEKIGLHSYVSILILCVYIVTVKLATLPVLLLPIFVFIKFKSEIRKLLLIIPLLSLIILPWLIRNIILTGWLIYPFYSLDLFNFDWKVSVSELLIMNEAVTGWARNPGEQYVAAAHMGVFEWFPLWWHGLMRTDKLFLLASIFFPLVAFIGYLMNKIKINFNAFTIVFISFIGVVFWFLLAPDLRFGKAFILIAAISPLLWFKFKFKLYWKPYYKSIYVFFALFTLLFVSFAKNNIGYNIIRIGYENSNRIITPQIIEIPANVNFETYNINGSKIYFPTKGDDNRCFNHCLPCTSYPDSTLILRGKTLQSGFKHNDKKFQIHL
jgi:hypothetical protein